MEMNMNKVKLNGLSLGDVLNGVGMSELPDDTDLLEWFKLLDAGWVYGGDCKKPHAKLHSGKHSDGFFLCKKVLAWGNLREIIAACIIEQLRRAYGGSLPQIDGVFGSPYSSILLAGDVGRLLGVKTYVVEKDPEFKGRMIYKGDDEIAPGSTLMQIEELVTTFDSASKTADAIKRCVPNVSLLVYVPTFVHRPPEISRDLPDGRVIVPLIERQVNAWESSDCPLCQAGSKALSPKTEWAELTA